MVADYYVIKLRRFELGWTQSDLAREAKLSLRTVQYAEQGKSIGAKSNGAIRRALGLN